MSSHIQTLQESVAIMTERLGRGLDELKDLREHLALPKFQGDGNDWISTKDVQAWISRLQEALTSEDVVRLGSKVMSWDTDSRYSGLRGKVIGFQQHEGCLRYRIQVTGSQIGSIERTEDENREVISPLNGTNRLFGGRCNGVELAS